MKRLWVVLILCLMVFVPLGQTGSFTAEKTSETIPADASSDTAVKRVYGENLAQEIYTDVSLYAYRDIVRKFTENGSRYIMDYSMANDGANYHARNYIIEQMEELSNGRIEIELIGRHYNVVGKLPGYLPGNHSALVVSAHYDSQQNSAGANCDGSGIAVVLSLVRMMSKYDWPLDIYFIAFNGLLTFDFMTGSPEVANAFQQRNIEILALYNVDSILVQGVNIPSDQRIQMGYLAGGQQNYHKGQLWGELARMMSNNYGTNAFVPVPSSSFYMWERSDQFSFFERTYTNVLCAFESGFSVDGSYQSATDIWNNVEYKYNLGSETAGVIGAIMAFTMSRAYGEPTTNYFSFSRGGAGTETFYFAVSTPTIVNVSARWFGGPSSFEILNPSGVRVVKVTYNTTSPWNATEVISKEVSTKGLYSIVVTNEGYTSVGYELTFTYDSDIDGNGILDKNEYWLDQSYFKSDQDSDGISDAYEIFWGTNLNDADTDHDNMPDKYEVDMGFDPLNAADGNLDADNDGLTNSQEYLGGLNPFSSDTDGDGMDDLWELEHGLDPLVNDADEDPDGDNLTNLEEYLQGSDPQEPEPKPFPIVWVVSPIVVVASIVIVVYSRRMKMY